MRNRNIGTLNGNWRGGEVRWFETDTPLPELTALQLLQARIDRANEIIFLHDLPEVIRLAKQMAERAQAEVWDIINSNTPIRG